ncbi:unnamed protein product [Sphenostylis stenocarpa]|uniref:DUF7796 domain-containing protein n=1 Tax=Sphenostylis stenocarpa TaxID=92480 RepID=A0AA86TBD1_9FABA|nr:unnamed protein product [Sphenostylis stenocarpa]
MSKSPRKFSTPVKWVSEINWRLTGLIIPLVLFLMFFSLHYSYTSNGFNAFYPVQLLLHLPFARDNDQVSNKEELLRSKIAVCLVGGARRFELTGPSIIENILKEYPNSDLFLSSPLDSDTFKFSLLKFAPHVAAVRIIQPQPLPENESYARVLTPHNSPNGIQGLLQYFNLVEGCLTMIKSHQKKNNFMYDWVVRTRVDGYWNAPLGPQNFVPGKYLVPPGSSYGGLNDRLGIGDLTTSTVALSRLSLIPHLDSAGFTNLNSEAAFKAQLTTQNVSYVANRLPFCVVSDRRYDFPPGQFGVPVAALSSPGPLSGAKCRPCTVVCEGLCVESVMESVEKEWSWTDWENGALSLCDAHKEWESGWEKIFDQVAGKKHANARKRIERMKIGECVRDFDELRKKSAYWSAPPGDEICTLGLSPP